MGKTFIGVRDVDEETFRKFRAVAIAEKKKLGKALSLAMKKLIEDNQKRERFDPKNLLKLEGIIKTKEKVRWSEEVDETLYGLRK